MLFLHWKTLSSMIWFLVFFNPSALSLSDSSSEFNVNDQCVPSLIFFLFGFGATGVYSRLYTRGLFLVEMGDIYGVLGVESRLAICKKTP